MDPKRKYWNGQQQILRLRLAQRSGLDQAIDLFLSQHAMVHSAEMSHAGLWSFEDETLEGLTDQQLRLFPRNGDHSIAWILWHTSRIEDVTMNLLVAGCPQVLLQENWYDRLNVQAWDTGNAMAADTIKELSARMDLDALRSYRLAVGRRTREIVKTLGWEQLSQKVDPVRLQQIRLQGAVLESAREVLDYWGGLKLTGLLLMPPTRHQFIHLNEMLRIRHKIQ